MYRNPYSYNYGHRNHHMHGPSRRREAIADVLDIAAYGYDVFFPSALHRAAKEGSVQGIKAAIADTLNVNELNAHGMSALMLACQSGHVGAVEVLLGAGAGAGINLCTENGTTALHFACACTDSVRLARLLVGNGADVRRFDMSHRTPMHYATERNHARVAVFLAFAGADPSATMFFLSGSYSPASRGLLGAIGLGRMTDTTHRIAQCLQEHVVVASIRKGPVNIEGVPAPALARFNTLLSHDAAARVEATVADCTAVLTTLTVNYSSNLRLKLILVGEKEQGKSSFCAALRHGKPPACRTRGLECMSLSVERANSLPPYRLQLLDFAGHGEYFSLQAAFLTDDSCVAVMVSLVSVRDTPETAKAGLIKWLDAVWNHTTGAVVIVLGTHLDVVADKDAERLLTTLQGWFRSHRRERFREVGNSTADARVDPHVLAAVSSTSWKSLVFNFTTKTFVWHGWRVLKYGLSALEGTILEAATRNLLNGALVDAAVPKAWADLADSLEVAAANELFHGRWLVPWGDFCKVVAPLVADDGDPAAVLEFVQYASRVGAVVLLDAPGEAPAAPAAVDAAPAGSVAGVRLDECNACRKQFSLLSWAQWCGGCRLPFCKADAAWSGPAMGFSGNTTLCRSCYKRHTLGLVTVGAPSETACKTCDLGFGVLQWKYACTGCGHAFCSKHASKYGDVPGTAKVNVLLCDGCHAKFVPEGGVDAKPEKAAAEVVPPAADEDPTPFMEDPSPPGGAGKEPAPACGAGEEPAPEPTCFTPTPAKPGTTPAAPGENTMVVVGTAGLVLIFTSCIDHDAPEVVREGLLPLLAGAVTATYPLRAIEADLEAYVTAGWVKRAFLYRVLWSGERVLGSPAGRYFAGMTDVGKDALAAMLVAGGHMALLTPGGSGDAPHPDDVLLLPFHQCVQQASWGMAAEPCAPPSARLGSQLRSEFRLSGWHPTALSTLVTRLLATQHHLMSVSDFKNGCLWLKATQSSAKTHSVHECVVVSFRADDRRASGSLLVVHGWFQTTDRGASSLQSAVCSGGDSLDWGDAPFRQVQSVVESELRDVLAAVSGTRFEETLLNERGACWSRKAFDEHVQTAGWHTALPCEVGVAMPLHLAAPKSDQHLSKPRSFFGAWRCPCT